MSSPALGRLRALYTSLQTLSFFSGFRRPKSWKRPKKSSYLKKKQEENAQKEVKIATTKKVIFCIVPRYGCENAQKK
jgi:hypothetical protein